MKLLLFLVLLRKLFVEGNDIFASVGSSAKFNWTLHPLQNPNEPVVIENKHHQNVLFATSKSHTVTNLYNSRLHYTGNTSYGEMSFTLKNVSKTDGGLYSAKYNAHTFPGQNLCVLDEPLTPIIKELSSPEMYSDLLLRCSLTIEQIQYGVPKYKWQIKRNNITTSNINAEATFVFHNVTEHDHGTNTTCEVLFPNGLQSELSNVYEVIPYCAPRNVELTSKNEEFDLTTEDVFFNITCNSFCLPKCAYYWTKYGSTDLIIHGSTFTLSNISSKDSGIYSCYSYNNYGSAASNNISINIKIPYYEPLTPTIQQLTPPERHSDLSLRCSLNIEQINNGVPKYKWQLKKNNITKSNINADATFVFHNVTEHDYGTNITCEVLFPNGLQSELSNVYEVIPYCAPRNVQLTPTNREFDLTTEDDFFNITCSSFCLPKCAYNWTKYGSTDLIIHGNVLTLPNISSKDSGIYSCYSYNNYGSAISHNITINIKMPYENQRKYFKRIDTMVLIAVGSSIALVVIFSTVIVTRRKQQKRNRQIIAELKQISQPSSRDKTEEKVRIISDKLNTTHDTRAISDTNDESCDYYISISDLQDNDSSDKSSFMNERQEEYSSQSDSNSLRAYSEDSDEQSSYTELNTSLQVEQYDGLSKTESE